MMMTHVQQYPISVQLGDGLFHPTHQESSLAGAAVEGTRVWLHQW